MKTQSIYIKGYSKEKTEVRVDCVLPDDANWYETKHGYARSHKYGLMHRYVMGFRKGDGMSHRYVDHVDGDRLNNTKSNLRIVTPKENSKNKSNDPLLEETREHKALLGVKWDDDKKIFTTVHKGVIYFENKSAQLCSLCYDSVVYHVYGKGKRLNDNTSEEPLPISRWDFSEEQLKNIELLKSRYTDYIGVKWTKDGWKAQITVDLGIYKTPEAAAQAYDKALLSVNKGRKKIEKHEFNFPKCIPTARK